MALYPLDKANFPIDPTIENRMDIHNSTENRHGISGYLADEQVAKRIHDALGWPAGMFFQRPAGVVLDYTPSSYSAPAA